MKNIAALNLSKYQGLTLDSLTDWDLSAILKVWIEEIETRQSGCYANAHKGIVTA